MNYPAVEIEYLDLGDGKVIWEPKFKYDEEYYAKRFGPWLNQVQETNPHEANWKEVRVLNWYQEDYFE